MDVMRYIILVTSEIGHCAGLLFLSQWLMKLLFPGCWIASQHVRTCRDCGILFPFKGKKVGRVESVNLSSSSFLYYSCLCIHVKFCLSEVFWNLCVYEYVWTDVRIQIYTYMPTNTHRCTHRETTDSPPPVVDLSLTEPKYYHSFLTPS